ncbi:hypothetical protein BLTE_03000 [Blastochloris tepida]|uniref:Uncharacterized protein n=2 Tax=Blastochloris tepida TaxID=2233851 RepID=A0A348FWD2_9HYPH|nr:hypothetical protein BLTE_03000 [Blastochloris tepida]
MIADLSHAIVLFPEAAGSYAEVGYFAGVKQIAKKTILVLDSKFQGSDSFISMGPARKIDKISMYAGNIQICYDNPDFSCVISRIKRNKFSLNRRKILFSTYNDISNFERMCIIHKCCEILSVATFDDIVFVLKGVFSARISTENVKQLMSILVGSGFIRRVGSYGHYCAVEGRKGFLFPREGFVEKESSLKLEIASICDDTEGEFYRLIDGVANAS